MKRSLDPESDDTWDKTVANAPLVLLKQWASSIARMIAELQKKTLWRLAKFLKRIQYNYRKIEEAHRVNYVSD